MVRTIIPITPEGLKTRHVGFLEMSEFYRWLKRWFEFNGYWKDSNEELYSETISSAGKKIDITWHCEKVITKYFTYRVDVVFLFIGVNKVEVQQDDRKIKIEKGDFEVNINAYVIKDVHGSALWKIYEKIILKRNIEEYANELADKVDSLHADIKAIFNQYVQ